MKTLPFSLVGISLGIVASLVAFPSTGRSQDGAPPPKLCPRIDHTTSNSMNKVIGYGRTEDTEAEARAAAQARINAPNHYGLGGSCDLSDFGLPFGSSDPTHGGVLCSADCPNYKGEGSQNMAPTFLLQDSPWVGDCAFSTEGQDQGLNPGWSCEIVATGICQMKHDCRPAQ